MLQAETALQEVVIVIQWTAPCPLSQCWASVRMRFWSVEQKTEVLTTCGHWETHLTIDENRIINHNIPDSRQG